jgi:hypothetical protein
MSRNFNRSKYESTSYMYTEAVNCEKMYTSSYNGDQREQSNEYRSAPNGVWPFFSPTAMTASRRARSATEQFARWHGTSQYIAYTRGMPVEGVPNTLSTCVGEARDLARYKATESLYSKLTDMDISETLVEARSVQKTINLAETIADLTRKAVGRFGITRVLSNGWMWTNYGVKPIVNDIFGLMEHTSRQVQKPFTIRAGHTEHYTVEPTSNPLSRATGHLTYRLTATLKSGAFDQLSQVTSMDPAYIAWTSLPWTFITDYFYNIGGYLRQLELQALYNTAFLHGTSSEKWTANGMLTSGYEIKTGWSCVTPFYNMTQESLNQSYYTRFPLYSLPVVQTPRVNLELGSGQLMNIAAALGSFLSTGK